MLLTLQSTTKTKNAKRKLKKKKKKFIANLKLLLVLLSCFLVTVLAEGPEELLRPSHKVLDIVSEFLAPIQTPHWDPYQQSEIEEKTTSWNGDDDANGMGDSNVGDDDDNDSSDDDISAEICFLWVELNFKMKNSKKKTTVIYKPVHKTD